MELNRISFHVNGQRHTVPADVHPATRLSDYLRQVAHLKGTKVSCREGGCGACVVTVTYRDAVTNRDRSLAINSCLCPISTVRGWQITTTEGLGGRQLGYHPIQRRMADHSATQCGFCTPGFVMSMNSLLQNNAEVSCDQVEKCLDGNLCRCTGYRSILKCMKSFAHDGPEAQPLDIEDLKPLGCGRACRAPGPSPGQRPASHLSWIRPQSLDQLYQLLDTHKDRKVRLVFGNTATGVYKKDRYEVYVDIRDVPDLYTVRADYLDLDIGSSITLTDLMEICDRYKQKPGFSYLQQLKEYLQTVANTPVRNAGSWAGNLMIMRDHPDFASDVYTPLAALGATITFGGHGCSNTSVSLDEFLCENMTSKVILSVHLPALGDHQVFGLYRTAPRLQSSISYVNMAVLVDLSEASTHTVDKAAIVFCGLGANNHRAGNVEDAIRGKSLDSNDTKTECLEMITKDLEGIDCPEHHRSLIKNLLYKFLSRFGGAGSLTQEALQRPLSSGTQDYSTEPDKYPITEPICKLSGKLQAAGEVVYVDDMPHTESELSAVLVLSTIGCGQLENIDTSLALSKGGAVDVVTAADIPGDKSMESILYLADDDIEYHGQPIALVLADDLGAAYRAAGMVKVTYKNVQRPITDIDEAIKEGHFHYQVPPCVLGDSNEAFTKCSRFVQGMFKHGPQYHFYLENYICLAVPSENGLDIWASAQDPTSVQKYVCRALGLTQNSVHVTVPRIGGGFGGKIVFPVLTAVTASVAALKTNRPVRLNTSLETCMKMTGHRPQIRANYKVGLDDNNNITAMDITVYWDGGHRMTAIQKSFCRGVMLHTEGAYYIPNCTINGAIVRTNQQTTVAMRSPRQLPGHMIIEHVMEHVARTVEEDPVAFKWRHLRKGNQQLSISGQLPQCQVDVLWADIMNTASVQQRQRDIEAFNQTSRWIKRGLAISPSKYNIPYMPAFSNPVYVAVCGPDGSVTISHGGVEMGQGLHTKVTQVAAHGLGIPMEIIKVRHVDTLTGVNTAVTGASQNSEFLCRTVTECCRILLNKLAPFREKQPDAEWGTLVQAAYEAGINLAVTERYAVPEFQEIAYIVHGVCVAEAEVDILTGQNQILRADLLMDIGQSVNPEVDVGQMEGALIMGLGLMLTEKQIRSAETGELTTASTWDYKVPFSGDIPVDMRITLMKGQHNNLGVYPSKALGEPPITCAPVFLHAVKAAVDASRKERGLIGYFPLYAPTTPEDIMKACDVTENDLIN